MRKVFGPQGVPRGQSHRPLHGILEFADVAPPSVAEQQVPGGRIDPQRGSSHLLRVILEKELGQGQNVVGSFTQGRDPHGDHIQPVIKVLPEGPPVDLLLEILVRSRQDPYIDLVGTVRAEGPNLPFLQNAQEPDLDGQREFPDFVQEEGASVSDLEKPFAGGCGAREGPLRVSEQFALQQTLRNGPTVDRVKRAGPPRALGMDGSGNQLLSRPTLPLDQNRGIHLGDPLDQPEDLLHLLASVDNALHPESSFQHTRQVPHLTLQPFPLQGVAHAPHDHIRLAGFGEHIVGTFLGRPYRVLHISLTGEYNHLGRRFPRLHPSQNLQPRRPFLHPEVTEKEVKILLFHPPEGLGDAREGLHVMALLT